MDNRYGRLISTILLALIVLAGQAGAQEVEKEFRVYEYVLRQVQDPFDSVSAAIERGALKAGWILLGRIDAGVPEKCPYRARVFALHHPAYAKQIMEANRKTGPFAIVDRINLFEDEQGQHISVVNPHSINRTVLMDDGKYKKMSAEHLQSLREMIVSSTKGTLSYRAYGEKRDRGLIGKTMGVMAGGKFDEKIDDLGTAKDLPWKTFAERVEKGLSTKGPKWGMHLVYRIDLPEFETVIFGTTGSPMDNESFSIVGAGSDDSRSDLRCPGLAHAAAYPIEVVVANDSAGVKVRMVDPMFRMKMYFEDAGNWAFMKHMGMPGSIGDELRMQIESALKPQ